MMKTFKTHITGLDSSEEYFFECYENDVDINIGDYYLFFFGGIASVGFCMSSDEMCEINKHTRPYNSDIIDMTHGFWRNCYLIKTTNFDYAKLG